MHRLLGHFFHFDPIFPKVHYYPIINSVLFSEVTCFVSLKLPSHYSGHYTFAPTPDRRPCFLFLFIFLNHFELLLQYPKPHHKPGSFSLRSEYASAASCPPPHPQHLCVSYRNLQSLYHTQVLPSVPLMLQTRKHHPKIYLFSVRVMLI